MYILLCDGIIFVRLNILRPFVRMTNVICKLCNAPKGEGGGGAGEGTLLLTAVVVFRTWIHIVVGCVCPYEVGPLQAPVRQSSVFVSPCHDNAILVVVVTPSSLRRLLVILYQDFLGNIRTSLLQVMRSVRCSLACCRPAIRC